MKLSQNIYRSCSICGNGIVENHDNAVDIKYKSDSQMLEDLIEMGKKLKVTLRVVHNVFYVEGQEEKECSHCSALFIDIGRETPREAIQAAITKWKKENES